MKLKVNRERHIYHTVTIWSGYYKLTELEKNITCSIIEEYLALIDKISDPELVKKNFLDSDAKKQLMEKYHIKPPQLTNYLKSLIKKKVLKIEEGTYYLDTKFIPSNKLVFEFVYE